MIGVSVKTVRSKSLYLLTTRDAMVIAGRRTVQDFPGQKPLPGRENVVLTRSGNPIPGFTVCASPQEAAELAKKAERAMVIGGGSVYTQMLPMCDTAYITKIHAQPESDTFFPNLDLDPQWRLEQVLQSGEEDGVQYEMCLYRRK